MTDDLFTHLEDAEKTLFDCLYCLDDIVLAPDEAERDEAWRKLRKSVHKAIASMKEAKKLLKGGE